MYNMFYIYLYPKINPRSSSSPNPYIFDLEYEISKYNTIVNGRYNSIGVLEFFKYFWYANMYIFNWIEDLPTRKFGKFQTIIFVIFLFSCKIFRKKIIWIFHNKYSHYINKNIWTDCIIELMYKYSDFILTHSKIGKEFLEEGNTNNRKNIKFIQHPVKETFTTSNNNEKRYDFLIWGSIIPYKGILEFLEFIRDTSGTSRLKILIVGKCKDNTYKSKLKSILTPNITYLDQFLSLEEINSLAALSKYILFTYKPESVLSSGALMDSIRMKTIILGPNYGVFKELSSFGFVKTYNEYNDIIKIKDHPINQIQNILNNIEVFCQANTWKIFGNKLQKELEKLPW